jgi:hypothetical protein
MKKHHDWRIENPRVGGSIPSLGTDKSLAKEAERSAPRDASRAPEDAAATERVYSLPHSAQGAS